MSDTRTVAKRVAQSVVSAAIVIGIFAGVLPRFASYSDVWDTLGTLNAAETVGLIAFGAWNIVTYWFVLVAVLPGLRYREAAVVNQASTAVSNTLPAGGAIGVGVTYAMYVSWGFPPSAIALSALVSGVWNNFVKMGMPVLAVVFLAFDGDLTPPRLTAAAVGLVVLAGTIAVFALILRSERLSRAIGERLGVVMRAVTRLLRRPGTTDWKDAAVRFRVQTIGLLHRRWRVLTLATVVSHTSLYLLLLLTLRLVGVGAAEVGWVQVFAAFSIVRLISALPVTPGGLGIVEAGYTIALTVGVDAATNAQIVAAVLAFRAITYLLPVPLGAVAYVVWRRNRTWRMSVDERAVLATAHA